MTSIPPEVRIVEVGPRDGLQNEAAPVPTEVKVEFIRRLIDAGCRDIEATSFVHPQRVPQLADAEQVLAALGNGGGGRISALVPNERGLERALAAGVKRIAVFAAASDTFSRRNIGMDVAASLEIYRRVVAAALAGGLTVRGYVSTAFECPYEGPVSPAAALPVCEALLEMGADEVSVGDTTGVAAPAEVYRLLDALAGIPRERLALHFHDTSGTALANVLAGLESGIAAFDSSAGGLGGCPFAPGATGNLATEDLIYMLERMGIRTGIDLKKLAAASRFIEAHLGRPLPSRQLQRLRAQAG